MSTGDGNGGDPKTAAGFLFFKRARQAKSGYDWADRVNWILSLFKTKAEVAMAAGSLGVVGVVGGMTAIEAIQNRDLETGKPAVMEKERSTANSTVFTIEGWDKAGRRGLFDVVVANKEFLWVRGSSEELEKDGRVIKGPEIAAAVFDAEVTAALTSAREIIAVGTASQEGAIEDEVARAGRRAKLTADLAAGAVAPGVPISTLNLGQYRELCAACETSGTSWQRPFIVIAAKELDQDTNVGEALADALTGKTKLPSPKSYSVFEVGRVR